MVPLLKNFSFHFPFSILDLRIMNYEWDLWKSGQNRKFGKLKFRWGHHSAKQVLYRGIVTAPNYFSDVFMYEPTSMNWFLLFIFEYRNLNLRNYFSFIELKQYWMKTEFCDPCFIRYYLFCTSELTIIFFITSLQELSVLIFQSVIANLMKFYAISDFSIVFF